VRGHYGVHRREGALLLRCRGLGYRGLGSPDPVVAGLPVGVIILATGGFMMFIGFMAIQKIVDIEV